MCRAALRGGQPLDAARRRRPWPRRATRRPAMTRSPARFRPAAPAQRRARTGADAAASNSARSASGRHKRGCRYRGARPIALFVGAVAAEPQFDRPARAPSSSCGAKRRLDRDAEVDERRLIFEAPGRRPVVGRPRVQRNVLRRRTAGDGAVKDGPAVADIAARARAAPQPWRDSAPELCRHRRRSRQSARAACGS